MVGGINQTSLPCLLCQIAHLCYWAAVWRLAPWMVCISYVILYGEINQCHGVYLSCRGCPYLRGSIIRGFTVCSLRKRKSMNSLLSFDHTLSLVLVSYCCVEGEAAWDSHVLLHTLSGRCPILAEPMLFLLLFHRIHGQTHSNNSLCRVSICLSHAQSLPALLWQQWMSPQRSKLEWHPRKHTKLTEWVHHFANVYPALLSRWVCWLGLWEKFVHLQTVKLC